MKFSYIYTLQCFKPNQKLAFAVLSVKSCSYLNTHCCIGFYQLSYTWHVNFKALDSVWFS